MESSPESLLSSSSPSGCNPMLAGYSRMNTNANGTARTRTSPNATQVIRQLVACNRYMAKGTISMPPMDAPAAFNPMTVARRRRNQRASIALVLFMDTPPPATDANTPYIRIKNSTLEVPLSSTVTNPTPIKPARITFLPPVASNTRPIKGWISPAITAPRKPAQVIVVRFHSNSSLIGMMKTPKALRIPVVTRAMNMKVATMYQPKYRPFRGAVAGGVCGGDWMVIGVCALYLIFS